MTGCSRSDGTGVSGGAANGFVHEGVYQKCSNGNQSLSSAGKVTEIDGVELKLPVDFAYANKKMNGSFTGNNWDGDDGVRGIGMFNCGEEGDGSTEYAESFGINCRWEYCGYGNVEGTYMTHATYTGVDSSGEVEVGGVSNSCVSGGGIINQTIIDNSGAYISALEKCRIIIYNPTSGKACVCATGNASVGSRWPSQGDGYNANWGGAPLALMGGITTAAAEAIEAVQPNGGENTVLELYFTDEDAELGPCDFSNGSAKTVKNTSKGKDSCDKAETGMSSIAECAVTLSYDENNPMHKDHEMIKAVTGSGSSSLLPTTQKCIDQREKVCGDKKTADCGFFVSTVVRTVVDQNFPLSYTITEENYMKSESSKYRNVATGNYCDIVNKLQPGDILVNDGHTFIHTGNEAIKAQFSYVSDDYTVCGASQDTHGPKIQTISYQASGGEYRAYRFIGTPDPHPNGGVSADDVNNEKGGYASDATTDEQRAIIDACYSTPSPGLNWCAAWVTNVYVNAGLGYYGGNACDMYYNYCHSSDMSDLKPGMMIAVATNPKGGEAGTTYGHVGIYIGDGIVMENIGNISETSLESWLSWYDCNPMWGYPW